MIIRAQQALHLLGLEPVVETLGDPNSYGFRRNRGTQDAIEQAFIVFARKDSAQWCLEGDITACFDSFGHGWLESHIPVDKKVLRDWLKAGYVESGKLFPTEAGTPQGGIASPTIANCALDGLEAKLTEQFGKTERARSQNKVHFVRYADDFLVSGTSRELLENEVKPLIEAFLSERGLQLSPTKTITTRIDEGFDFLGQNIRKYGKQGKLLIKPSAKNRKAFLDKVRETVRKHRASKQVVLIDLLNPMIRGWANYHRHVCAKETYQVVDCHIWHTNWRWARRRHPEKSAGWVRKKYYRNRGHRRWVFETASVDRRGRPRTLQLYSASDTKIARHTKVKSEANPFDPKWDAYFAQRKNKRMTARLLDGSLPKRLWQQQKGCCPVCEQPMEETERWAIRPKVPLEASSARPLADFVMLHDSCRSSLRVVDGQLAADDSRVPAPS
jgi:RNA-directed DNA polymerase